MAHSGKAQEFTVIVEQDEDGFYVGEVPELKGCYTQARSLDELMERLREVIRLCLDEQGPPPPRNRFIGVQRIAV